MFHLIWMQLKGALKVLIPILSIFIIFSIFYNNFFVHKSKILMSDTKFINLSSSEEPYCEKIENKATVQYCQECLGISSSKCLCFGQNDGQPCLNGNGICCNGECKENVDSCFFQQTTVLPPHEICQSTSGFWCEKIETCYSTYEEYCQNCLGACQGEQK